MYFILLPQKYVVSGLLLAKKVFNLFCSGTLYIWVIGWTLLFFCILLLVTIVYFLSESFYPSSPVLPRLGLVRLSAANVLVVVKLHRQKLTETWHSQNKNLSHVYSYSGIPRKKYSIDNIHVKLNCNSIRAMSCSGSWWATYGYQIIPWTIQISEIYEY